MTHSLSCAHMLSEYIMKTRLYVELYISMRPTDKTHTRESQLSDIAPALEMANLGSHCYLHIQGKGKIKAWHSPTLLTKSKSLRSRSVWAPLPPLGLLKLTKQSRSGQRGKECTWINQSILLLLSQTRIKV